MTVDWHACSFDKDHRCACGRTESATEYLRRKEEQSMTVDWPEEHEIIRFISDGADGFDKGTMVGYVIRDGMKWMVEIVHPAIVEREGFADEVREKYAHLIGDEPWGDHGTT